MCCMTCIWGVWEVASITTAQYVLYDLCVDCTTGDFPNIVKYVLFGLYVRMWRGVREVASHSSGVCIYDLRFGGMTSISEAASLCTVQYVFFDQHVGVWETASPVLCSMCSMYDQYMRGMRSGLPLHFSVCLWPKYGGGGMRGGLPHYSTDYALWPAVEEYERWPSPPSGWSPQGHSPATSVICSKKRTEAWNSCSLPFRRVHEIKRMYLDSRTHGLFIT